MVQITAATTFLHDRDRFEEGETFDVADGLAAYFVAAGWATTGDVEGIVGAAPQDVTLDIEPGDHSTASDLTEG